MAPGVPGIGGGGGGGGGAAVINRFNELTFSSKLLHQINR